MQLEPGTDVGGGRYQVEALLGQGGMASVYRVRHAQLGTPLALKVLSSASLEQRDRLLREGRAQASLRHTNIVSVVDVIEIDGLAALVMEYIDGPDLAHVLKRRRLTAEQADDLMRGILAGVAAAHDQGFVHRDLKPGNILLAAQRSRPVPRVADFGLVKQLAGGGEAATRTGALMGTPAYMAPEQIRDAGKVDARADVFALGAIAYELLCGVRAFDGDDAFDTFEAIVRGRYVPLAERVAGVDPRLDAVIQRALSTDSASRFADAGAMEAAWLEGAPSLSARMWAGDALVSASSSPPEPGAFTPQTYSLEAPASVSGTVDPPAKTAAHSGARDSASLDAPGTAGVEATPQTEAGRPRWGLPALLLVVVAVVAAGLWFRPAQTGPPLFTVRGAPELFTDEGQQAQLRRAWEAALRDDVREARLELEPLLEAKSASVDLAALSLMLAGDVRDPAPYIDLVGRVPLVEKAENRGAAICVRGIEYQLTGWAHVDPNSEDWQQANQARLAEYVADMQAWLEDHPDDLLSAICLGSIELMDPWKWTPYLDAANPEVSALWPVREVVDRLLLMGELDEAQARVSKAREVAPTSGSLIGLEAEILARREDHAGAVALFAEALEREPTRLDLRRKAAQAAFLAGDEAAVQAHLPLVLAREWPAETRSESLDELVPYMVIAGRPGLLLDAVESEEWPARALLQRSLFVRLWSWPGYAGPEQRERMIGYFKKGCSPPHNRPVVTNCELTRTIVEAVQLVTTEGAVPPGPDVRWDHPLILALFATMEGDPEPLIAFADKEYAGLEEAWRDLAAEDRLAAQRCWLKLRYAAAYHHSGDRERALQEWGDVMDMEECDGQVVRPRAFAAGQLALAAFERGAPEDAAPYVALYQEQWPIAGDEMPLAQALAKYGVVTGPNRAAWEAENAR